MEEIKVLDYKVYIGQGALRQICGKRAIIISDDNVYPIYSKAIECNFDESIAFVFTAGEKSKTLKTYEEILAFLAKNHVDRSDTLIALGGGVVGDITGFVAATYMRGIDYIQVPTTLLAAIDSSVGGKTAVNMPEGKNLVGAFHQPKAVYFDPDTLFTLDRRQFNSAMAEAIKYSILSGRDIPDDIEAPEFEMPEGLIEMVKMCIEVKRDFVEKDPFDKDQRRALNLGHTIGHAMETLSGYSLLHGEAVAIGLAEMAKRFDMDGKEKLIQLLDKYILPTELLFSEEDVMKQIRIDKKVEGEDITLVIPKAFGKWEFKKVKL